MYLRGAIKSGCGFLCRIQIFILFLGDLIKSEQKFTRSQKAESKQTYNKSAITDHAGRENHVIDWEGTQLVARENQDWARRIREAIWIKRTPNNMNRDGGAYQLSDIYDAAIAKTTTTAWLS